MRSMQTDVDIGEINWRAITRLWPYLLEFKGRITVAVLCLIGAKVASVSLPFLLKNIVDSLDVSTGTSSTTNTAVSVIIVPLGLLLAYGIVRFSNVLFGELRDSLFGRVTERAMRRIGLKAFMHLHALDLDFHLNRRTGGLARDIERGTSGISFLLRFMVFNIVPTLLEIALVIGLLWKNYSGWFALIVLLAVLAYIAFSVVATEWRTQYVRMANKAETESSSRAVDSLLNYETVKYFTNEKYEQELYDKELVAWELARRKNRLTLFALNGGQALIIACAMTASMVLAAQGVAQSTMTLGDFVLINAFMMQIFMPLNFLGFVYREMKGALANIEKLFGLLAIKPNVEDAKNACSLIVTRGDIRFENVSFGYSANRQILKNVSFDVPSNKKVAIVGSSGAGKSTLFKLLFRFYNCTEGRILIDGQDIAAATQTSLRRNIGVIPQDTVLFNTTLYDNIQYGRVDATEHEVNSAISLAHLDTFIDQLPEGKATLVGERGLKLSGGEKQRVAIARAVLKRPPIMIFDEATSSLDSESEKNILSAMNEVSREQTSIVIAHRLSTIVDSDSIVVLEQGQVVEQGSHQELLALQGRYADLWDIQQRERSVTV